jgi:hypothetical protein
MRRSPEEVSRLERNANYYKLMGQPELGLREMELAHRQNPDNLQITDLLAQNYEEQGKFEAARQLYQEALGRHGHHAVLANNLCFSYYHEGRWQEAETCFRQTLDRDPGNVSARNNLGLLYCRLGRQDEARRLWQETEGVAAVDAKMSQALAVLGEPSRAVYARRPEPTPPAARGTQAPAPTMAVSRLPAPIPAKPDTPAQPATPKASAAPVAAKPPAPAPTPVAAKSLTPTPAPVVAKPPASTPAPVAAKPTAPTSAVVAATPATPTPAPVAAKPPAPVATKPPAPAPAPVAAQTPAQAATKPPAPTPAPVEATPQAEARKQAVVAPKPLAAETPAPAPQAPLTAAERADKAIEVRNGSRTKNLAQQTRSLLQQEGFSVARIGDHRYSDAAKTTILYRPGAKKVAQELGAAVFPEARLAPSKKLKKGMDILVLLRGDLLENPRFMARLNDSGPPAAPSPQPPAAADMLATTKTEAGQPPLAAQSKAVAAQPLTSPAPSSLTAAERVDTAIEVRNGTWTKDLARQTRSKLCQEGFTVAMIGNHVDFGATKTIIYYRPEAERVARTVGRTVFPQAALEPNLKLKKGMDIKILLGADLLKSPQLMARLVAGNI